MLAFQCTSCGQRLALAETWAGKKCRCSVCGAVLDVPRPSDAPLAAPASRSGEPSRTSGAARLAALTTQRAQGNDRGTIDRSAIDEQTLPPRSDKSAGDEASSSGPATVPEAADSELYDFLAPPEAADEIGRLGGYRIVKVLGSGGMGVVFQAEDLRLQRAAALKTMLPSLAASAANRRRFHQEAKAAAALEHDHIVTIYQVGEDRGVPFIAMQLLKGESLEQRLVRVGRLEAAELLRMGRETASGLAVAHERGLIHRDIKPSNIWLETRAEPRRSGSRADNRSLTAAAPFRVKILDFGLARSLADNVNLTGQGTILGTPAYMAPEQARGQTVDARADLFSLGCVLYRAATGRSAFAGADTIATLMAVTQHTPPPPHRLNPRLPLPVSQLILMLMAKDAAARPPSARAVVETFEKLEHGRTPAWAEMSVSALPQTLPVEPASSPPRSRTPAGRDEPTVRLEEGLPRPSGRSRLLAAVLLGTAAGFVLLIAVGLLAFVLWRTTGRKDASLDRRDAGATASQGGPPALSAEIQTLLRDDVRQRNYSKTKIVGFPFAPEFEEIPPNGALLVGFEVGLGKWGPNDVINSIRAIYRNDKGELLGDVHGKPTGRIVTVKAKPGYVVATIGLNTHLLIDGMRITFMRLKGKFLDADDSYQEIVARISDKEGQPPLGGALIVGICGKADNKVCNAFGLVLRGGTAK